MIFRQTARAKALETLLDLNKKALALESELSAYGDCDPVKVEETKRAVFLAKEAALRWTGEFVSSRQREILLSP